MKNCRLFFVIPSLIAVVLFSLPDLSESALITEYNPIFLAGRDSRGAARIAIRKYKKDGVPFLLLVDPFSFGTSIIEASSFAPGGDTIPGRVDGNPYVRALDRYSAPPRGLQNHGLVHGESPMTGVFLTIDMCPSAKPFERGFFLTLAEAASHRGSAVPVAVAITGKWLKTHGEDFAWLVERIREGKLAVTWINHSATHPYNPDAPMDKNFLLTPGIDFEKEVLDTERLLLENGLIPSPFFRFPGLVANGALVGKLRKLALIPIGSDAWLAKGETPVNGSVILVHGNGNEPLGISMALRLLKVMGEARLLPLREAFSSQTGD